MFENNEQLLTPNVLKMLKQLEQLFSKFGIDYFIVGAFARDLHFENYNDKTILRKTSDIDIAICLSDESQFRLIVKALEETGDFKQNEKEPIKLEYKHGIEVDLLPFGGIENEHRETKLINPKVFIINVPGFAEAAAFTVEIKSDEITLNTCSIEGLILLKLISWDDRNQRTQDLTDIDNIIDACENWLIDEIFETQYDLFDKYDVEDLKFYLKMITAHVVGRKMKLVLANSKELYERVINILSKKENPRWVALMNGLQE